MVDFIVKTKVLGSLLVSGLGASQPGRLFCTDVMEKSVETLFLDLVTLYKYCCTLQSYIFMC